MAEISLGNNHALLSFCKNMSNKESAFYSFYYYIWLFEPVIYESKKQENYWANEAGNQTSK